MLPRLVAAVHVRRQRLQWSQKTVEGGRRKEEGGREGGRRKEYERNAAGNWQGSFVARQGGYALLGAHQALMNRLSDELTTVLTADYPDHMQSIGIGGSSGILQAHMIIGRLAHEALRRFGSLATSDEQLDQLLADTAAFFDRRNIRLRLIAPVLNVHGPRDIPPIPFFRRNCNASHNG